MSISRAHTHRYLHIPPIYTPMIDEGAGHVYPTATPDYFAFLNGRPKTMRLYRLMVDSEDFAPRDVRMCVCGCA
jgi:hypothetical protein